MVIPLISLMSQNIKTGPIPTVSRPQSTCAPLCPLLGKGCYGENRRSGGAPSIFDQADRAKYKFPLRMLAQMAPAKWAPAIRFNVVGDYFTEDGTPDQEYIDDTNFLAQANDWVPISYTHGWRMLQPSMFKYVVRASTQSREELEEAHAAGWWTVVVDPGPDDPDTLIGQVIDGRKVVQCPATNGGAANCADCRLCGREAAIVAFPVHGARKGLVARVVDGIRRADEQAYDAAA